MLDSAQNQYFLLCRCGNCTPPVVDMNFSAPRPIPTHFVFPRTVPIQLDEFFGMLKAKRWGLWNRLKYSANNLSWRSLWIQFYRAEFASRTASSVKKKSELDFECGRLLQKIVALRSMEQNLGSVPICPPELCFSQEAQDLLSKTQAQLKVLCRLHGLKVTGVKPVLVKRLHDHSLAQSPTCNECNSRAH
jgi:hypothetical protein